MQPVSQGESVYFTPTQIGLMEKQDLGHGHGHGYLRMRSTFLYALNVLRQGLACLCKRPHVYVPVITSLTSHVTIITFLTCSFILIVTCLTIQKASYHYHFSARAAVYPSSLVWLLWMNVCSCYTHCTWLMCIDMLFHWTMNFRTKLTHAQITDCIHGILTPRPVLLILAHGM